jgi:hypothetical protein
MLPVNIGLLVKGAAAFLGYSWKSYDASERGTLESVEIKL